MKHQIDPYELGRYPLFRFRGSVFFRIRLPLLFAVLWTVLIVCVDQLTPVRLGVSPQLLSIMSIVTGLILVFRTNTAYDRYWEGRRLWATVHTAIRNASRIIWVHAKEPNAEAIIIKKSAINLLAAFAVSTKHYLRHKYSYDYDDLAPLIKHIPKYATPAANINYPLSPAAAAADNNNNNNNYQPPPPLSNPSLYTHLATPTNLPLELTLYLSSYLGKLRTDDHIDVPTYTVATNQITILVDCLTGFERILRSPIPLAYSIHLSHTVWLYILALPFQLVQAYGWPSIAIGIITAFTFLGIEAIGKEIENPFGYDYNDLPLDDFCNVIKFELEVITSQPPPTVSEWALNDDNHPFPRMPLVSAADLIRDRASLDEVRSMLSVNTPDDGRDTVSDSAEVAEKPLEVAEKPLEEETPASQSRPSSLSAISQSRPSSLSAVNQQVVVKMLQERDPDPGKLVINESNDASSFRIKVDEP